MRSNVKRNNEIIKMRKEKKTLRAIGKKFGISGEAVRQILKKNGIEYRDIFPKKTCGVDGCDRTDLVDGVHCAYHWRRFDKGLPMDTPKFRARTPTPVECSVEGCDRPVYLDSLCQTHWRRRRNHETDWHRPIAEATNQKWTHCREPGCERKHYAKGLCRQCYHRARKRGERKKMTRRRRGDIYVKV